MRLSSAWIIAFTSSSSYYVDGFQFSTSLSSRCSHRVAISSSKSVAAAAVDEAVGTTSMSYDEVNKLAFRALQRECKVLGLSAVGTTAALRGRLLEYFGLSKEASSNPAPAATVAEIEVRFRTFLFRLLESWFISKPSNN